MTPEEKRLCVLLKKIDPDKDIAWKFCVAATCRRDELTSELVEYIEKNNITDPHDIDVWLYGEEETDQEENED